MLQDIYKCRTGIYKTRYHFIKFQNDVLSGRGRAAHTFINASLAFINMRGNAVGTSCGDEEHFLMHRVGGEDTCSLHASSTSLDAA